MHLLSYYLLLFSLIPGKMCVSATKEIQHLGSRRNCMTFGGM